MVVTTTATVASRLIAVGRLQTGYSRNRPKAVFAEHRFMTRKLTFEEESTGGYDGQPKCSVSDLSSAMVELTLSFSQQTSA